MSSVCLDDISKHGFHLTAAHKRITHLAVASVPVMNERALVLGGGGAAGNAWVIGVIAGLFDAGLDVTEADLIIGTSAGSTAAAQITSATRRPNCLPTSFPLRPSHGLVRSDPTVDAFRFGRRPTIWRERARIIAAAKDAADMRRRMGAAALEMDAASDGSAQTQWRATVAARLPSQHWPQRSMLITAVDAHTGEPVVFDRHSGVDLADAVAASSCRRLRRPSLQHWRQPIHRRRLPSATRMPIWQPDTGGCWCCHHSAADHGIRWSGACILQRRSTNYAHAAAESKPSSRIATLKTHSASASI